MISFKSLVIGMSVAVLLGACNRVAVDDEVQPESRQAPESALAQSWEPIPTSPEGPSPAHAPQGAGPSQLPGAGGAGIYQPKAPFPEGALRARQAPVPDEILAAEIAAVDAAGPQQAADPMQPDVGTRTPATRRAQPSSSASSEAGVTPG